MKGRIGELEKGGVGELGSWREGGISMETIFRREAIYRVCRRF